ncbi:Spondin-2 [Gracilariopsis chorda]|uniref:Spondin-2 n=1 Tax=Gracilariopsis chorda TaxID=448386 RepID=A0A2V3ITG4_9FLOR|nr:Spondin-2 [Gracilariopsis chorda]|eukprot:PXF45411.1 Spondin-2 [Gracilariopsis chorda]
MPLSALLVLLLLLLPLLPHLARADCEGDQSYVLSLQMSFTKAVNPLIPPPEKARIPVVVAVAHKPSYHLFEKAKKLTDQAAEVASAGKADDVKQQFKKLSDKGDVASFQILKDVPIDDLSQLELRVKGSASRISLMAQLSPSPAWFIGIDSLDLCQQSKFILERSNIRVKNFNSGLDRSREFDMSNPYNEGETIPVEPLAGTIDNDDLLAVLSVEQGTLGVDWWKILLGVLVALAVIVVTTCVLIPLWRRRRKRADIPLTTQQGTEW